MKDKRMLLRVGSIIEIIYTIVMMVYYILKGKLTDEVIANLFILIIGFIVWLFVGGIIGCFLPKVEVVEEHELCALSDSSSVEGVNYLFSGYIDEKLVCRYVIDTERGKHIEEEKTDNVYIKEGNYTPTVKIHRMDLKKDWYDWFAHKLFVEGYYVEFFVPENTVTSEYKIDLR